MKYASPQTPDDVLLIYQHAIAKRNQAPDRSRALALDAFNETHPLRCAFASNDALNELRFEMGALEAPGSPPEGSGMSQQEYEDRLWTRLERLVEATARQLGGRHTA
jgi:hypothetical protein